MFPIHRETTSVNTEVQSITPHLSLSDFATRDHDDWPRESGGGCGCWRHDSDRPCRWRHAAVWVLCDTCFSSGDQRQSVLSASVPLECFVGVSVVVNKAITQRWVVEEAAVVYLIRKATTKSVLSRRTCNCIPSCVITTWLICLPLWAKTAARKLNLISKH